MAGELFFLRYVTALLHRSTPALPVPTLRFVSFIFVIVSSGVNYMHCDTVNMSFYVSDGSVS